MKSKKSLKPIENVQRTILCIRGQKVILDADLSKIYGVSTKRLNEQVRRNIKRFPDDFMFKLTAEEKNEVVANCDHLSNLRYSRALPLAFTEHGAIMAASVLNSPRAIEASIFVVRAFVEMRQIALKYTELADKIRQLEGAIETHDEQFRIVFEAITQLIEEDEKPKRKIGYIKPELSDCRGRRSASGGLPQIQGRCLSAIVDYAGRHLTR
jgi:hypothetical protein